MQRDPKHVYSEVSPAAVDGADILVLGLHLCCLTLWTFIQER